MIYDVIIIGGGPSGLMAANQFEASGINYLLLEKNDVLGKKLLLTGGRRCNVTNRFSPSDFIENLTIKNKKFLYSGLTHFGTDEIKSFFSIKGVDLVLEEDFKYFPKTQKSQSILDALTKNIKHHHIKFSHAVKSIEKENHYFVVKTKTYEYRSLNVIVGTGSKSFPTTGSNGDGLIFAKHFNIAYDDFSPAETYVFSQQVVKELSGLQGVSIKDCKITINHFNKASIGDLIFTHKGLSGPVIMHLSEFIDEDIKLNGKSIISVSFVNPDEQELYEYLLDNKDQLLHKALEKFTSKKVVELLLQYSGIKSKKITEIKKNDLLLVSRLFTKYSVIIDSVEDRERAYVNKGGIQLNELNPKTMEVKKVKGLYFIGETTGLHGPIGGYNLTIAFSTGYMSATHVIESIQLND